jgi:homoserine kinase
VIVRAPASSANLGSGFDAIALALDLPFELAVDEPSVPEGFLDCEPTHPAVVAFDRGGGDRSAHHLAWRSPIPPGRGLGFSGAARVAGAFAASGDRDVAATVAAELDGHADNAAASAHGGAVVTSGGRVVAIPLGAEMDVAVWWPRTETSTTAARRILPDQVPFTDAVHNVAHAALLVASLVAGDLAALDVAVDDRLHQERRLASAPASREAMAAMRDAGAIATWLSGSGPTVAAFVAPGSAEDVLRSCPPEGTGRGLVIARRGVEVAGEPHRS